jgi:hypothetical protein
MIDFGKMGKVFGYAKTPNLRIIQFLSESHFAFAAMFHRAFLDE